MAVTQYFAFEIDTAWISEEDSNPEVTIVKVDRAAAESLHDELGMALYPGGVTGAEVPVQGPMEVAMQEERDYIYGTESPRSMTPDEALAAIQVQDPYVRLPDHDTRHQSTFGTKHV